MTIEEFIAEFCEKGEEEVVGQNLLLNRGTVKPEDLERLQANIPPGTAVVDKWGFGDNIHRIWVNADYPWFGAYSALSFSLHIWRYPGRVAFLVHLDDVAEFFGERPFSGIKYILSQLGNPDAPKTLMDRPIRESLSIHNKEVTEAAMGALLDLTPRELSVELMMEELGK